MQTCEMIYSRIFLIHYTYLLEDFIAQLTHKMNLFPTTMQFVIILSTYADIKKYFTSP